jgi:hypothetical protein
VTRRILLIGATGVFGSRLAQMLAQMAGLDLMLAARRTEPLMRLKANLEARGARASLSVHAFDRSDTDILESLRPWLVVDASGPFQQGDYALALSAVRAGAHYIDLADGRAFVAGFAGAVGAAAGQAGVLAVSGASSTPALSHAALDDLTAGWTRLDTVMAVIAPGGRAPRGLSVTQAILSYVGRPVRVFARGAWREAPGWSGSRRLRMPGLGARWASICETPDLDLLPARFRARDEALFLAGLDPPAMHLGLLVLSFPVRLGLLASLRPFAGALRALAGLMTPFGSDRGGMLAEAAELDAQGESIRTRWGLWAEANAGPSTPAAPAAALIRALLEGREARRGARSAAGLLTLNAIVRELDVLPISRVRQEAHPASPSLFRRLLGRRFDTLPTPVRVVHAGGDEALFHGVAVAHAGRSLPCPCDAVRVRPAWIRANGGDGAGRPGRRRRDLDPALRRGAIRLPARRPAGLGNVRGALWAAALRLRTPAHAAGSELAVRRMELPGSAVAARAGAANAREGGGGAGWVSLPGCGRASLVVRVAVRLPWRAPDAVSEVPTGMTLRDDLAEPAFFTASGRR